MKKKITKVEKRRKCLTDADVCDIAVRVFDGERRSAIAKKLGISASYLSRLLDDARTRGLYRIEVRYEDL